MVFRFGPARPIGASQFDPTIIFCTGALRNFKD